MQMRAELARQSSGCRILRVSGNPQLCVALSPRIADQPLEQRAADAATLPFPLHAEGDLARWLVLAGLFMQLSRTEHPVAFDIAYNSRALREAAAGIGDDEILVER